MSHFSCFLRILPAATDSKIVIKTRRPKMVIVQPTFEISQLLVPGSAQVVALMKHYWALLAAQLGVF